MSGADLVLAAILLTTPPGIPEPTPPPDRGPSLRDAIHHVAVEWEILDPRETRYVLARPEDFCADLNMLRRRYKELADAPPAADGFRFPDRNAVNETVRFNRAFRKHLDQRQQLEDRPTDVPAQGDGRDGSALHGVGRGLDSRREFDDIAVRRTAPRSSATWSARRHQAGTLPPGVPTWRFNQLK